MSPAPRADPPPPLWLLLEGSGDSCRVIRLDAERAHAWGLSAADLRADAASLLRVLHPEDRPATLEALLASAGTDGFRARGAAGGEVDVSAGALPGGESCATERAVCVRAAGDGAAREAAARWVMSDRLASVGTLAAGLAHEINNPLSYVLANLQLVLEEAAARAEQGGGDGRSDCRGEDHRGGGAAAWLEPLRDSLAGAERIREIVRDMQAFNRAPDATVEPVDPVRALEAALAMVRNELRHRARLVKRLAPVPRVLANEGRLRQVFLNLLLNAVQALPDGDAPGAERVVEVASGVLPDGRVFVHVRDTGSGIADEVRARVFDPFFTTRPVGSGTGMGLFVCHAIVTTLGGEIAVESEAGRGSVFRVVLPAAPRDRSARAASPASDVVPRPPRGRVLVVDDEPMVARAVRRALRDAHEVEAALDGREALGRLLAGEDYDVVLCDLLMPELGGMELFVRAGAARPEVAGRFVFLTGGAFTDRAREFLAGVPNALLEKPFAPEDLRALVAARVWAARNESGRGRAGG